MLKPCLITAYDITRRQAKFLTQLDAQKNAGDDFYVKDVARATSAAPTYFEVASGESTTEVPYPLIDGGVFANNPGLCAYAEVRHKWENRPTAVDMVILSIGTGYPKKERYSYNNAKNWGLIRWAKPLVDIMMSGVSETVDYQLAQIFDAVGKPEQDLRVNGELLFANDDMDDASDGNLTALQQDGMRIAEESDSRLDAVVNLLLQ